VEQSEAEDFNHPARRMYRSLYAAAARSEQVAQAVRH
jgi:hypothetical protein